MRVCFISPGATSLFHPDLPPTHSGAELQFYLLSRELAKNPEFDVCFIAHGEGSGAEVVDGVQVIEAPFTQGVASKVRFQRAMLQTDADVYLQRGIGSITKEVAFFCLWRGRRFVYWIAHDNDVDPSVEQPEIDRTRWFEWGMLRANHVIAQTRWQAEALKKNFGRDSTVIPNSLPKPAPSEAPKDIVLWVGRYVPTKRPELFIELARSIPDQSFVLVGPASGKQAETHLAATEATLRETPNVERLGMLPFNDVEALFDRARLLVNTSISEGFPNTFLQAMWRAVPLASFRIDPDGFIRENDLGVAPSDDFEVFKNAVADLLHAPDRLQECGRRALACAETRHELTRNVRQLAQTLGSYRGRVRPA